MHEEKMRSFFHQEFPGESLAISADLLPKTRKKIDEMKDPKSIFDFAIEREKMAQEAYNDLAINCEVPEMKEFFIKMANDEKNHAEVLFAEIEKLENTMIWFDESELNGLMEY